MASPGCKRGRCHKKGEELVLWNQEFLILAHSKLCHVT